MSIIIWRDARDFSIDFENLVNLLLPGVGVPESTEQGLELFHRIIREIGDLQNPIVNH